jgi:hypothetical protein
MKTPASAKNEFEITRTLTIAVKDANACTRVENIQLRPHVFADLESCTDISFYANVTPWPQKSFHIYVRVDAPTNDTVHHFGNPNFRQESVYVDPTSNDPMDSGPDSYARTVLPPKCQKTPEMFRWPLETMPPDANGFSHNGISENLVKAVSENGSGPLKQVPRPADPSTTKAK